jgi:small subunit ribosomal protein S8
MMTDPIADLLTRIRNALMAAHETTEIPYSRIREEMIRILKEEGYLVGYSVVEDKPVNRLKVLLKYQDDRTPVITRLSRVSKPGRRVYAGAKEIPSVLGGLGITILSTSQGLMTGKAAREQGIGGEVLCNVY